MLINFLPKAVNLDPPALAKNLLPDWYKMQEGYNSYGHPSIKRCIPIFDAMSSGYFLTAQANITIDSRNPGGLIVSADNDFNGTLFSQHDLSQYNKYPVPEGYHQHLLRIHPMWCVQTPKGYSSIFLNPIHNGSKNILAMTGLIDTDNFISDGHLSFFVRTDTVFNIKKGTPLVQVIPVYREEWESNLIDLDSATQMLQDQDDTGIMIDGNHQNGGYKKLFHSPKNYQ